MKVLVPVSGGKDSQVCLKLAVREFGRLNVRGLFCDTKFEHPLTYQHVDDMRHVYGVEIDVVNGGTVLEKSLKHGRFPGGGARHCTDELKIRETRIYLKVLAEKIGGFEVWYGMRSGESKEREKRYDHVIDADLYHPHEILPRKYPKYLGKMGVRFRLPILDWATQEVLEYLGNEANPLYAEGFDRVGCFPCLASGDKWKEKAFQHDDFGREQYRKVIMISQEIKKDIFTSKGGRARNVINADSPGCAVCEI